MNRRAPFAVLGRVALIVLGVATMVTCGATEASPPAAHPAPAVAMSAASR